jgi:hypothetical protein
VTTRRALAGHGTSPAVGEVGNPGVAVPSGQAGVLFPAPDTRFTGGRPGRVGGSWRQPHDHI